MDAAVREVNRLLGAARGEGEKGKEGAGTEASTAPHSLLKVDRRYI